MLKSELPIIRQRMLESAQREHSAEGMAMPTMMLLRRDGGAGMFRPPGPSHTWRNHTESLRVIVDQLDVWCVVFTFEAWTTRSHLRPEALAHMGVDDMPLPSEDPERGECIWCVSVDCEGHVHTVMSEIKRTPFGSTFQPAAESDNPAGFRDGTKAWLTALVVRP